MLFKRLFIGLIILSALTAEGTAFFNTALAPLQNYIADLYSGEDDKDSVAADIPTMDTGLSPVRYGIYAYIPIDEIINSRNSQNISLCFSYSFSNTFYPVTYGLAHLSDNVIKNPGIILNASDISPPAAL